MMGSSSPKPDQSTPNMAAKGPHNKLLEQVVRTPDRLPSPQPTHLNVPNHAHRVLHEEGSGYVAPKFEGKAEQMEKYAQSPSKSYVLLFWFPVVLRTFFD